jgi:hypothetical protein
MPPRSTAPAGFRLADGFISRIDLISIGLLTAQEATELHDVESGRAVP